MTGHEPAPGVVVRPDSSRVHLGLMLALTFGTGVVDAVGYLGLDRVFTGNMTGNVAVLGMGLGGLVTGSTGLPVVGPALALAGFLVGAVIAGRALRRASAPWTWRTTALLTAGGLTILGLAVVVLLLGDDRSQATTVAVTTVLAVAMGSQAATARSVAVRDVSTVALTATLTGLAADVPGSGHRRRALAVALLLAGAAAGAVLLLLGPAIGLAAAAAVSLGCAAVGAGVRR